MAMLSNSQTRILPYSPETLSHCSDLLRMGKLVGMPTETVYGLAANALDAEACKLIFITKGRPLTDPLIVHVHSVEQALTLIDQEERESQELLPIFKELTAYFWPGPLTVIMKANSEVVPSLITAETGFVGLRMPNHNIALELLRTCELPLAAPSANKFGHVSPSRAEHVYNDFHADSEVAIIDGGSCNFGIESTVLKLSIDPTSSQLRLTILRKGGVSEKALCESLIAGGHQDFIIEARKHVDFKPETENLEGPGQFLRHYAPNIDSYLYSGEMSPKIGVSL
jgi:tRNA threonylcarbamoyl adenosine modification protein (Sua5/YciO/YrdC/YwlC family)